jgi:hypothetical protein
VFFLLLQEIPMIKIKILIHYWQRKGNKQENVSEWWVSEKLDGVHAIWNGENFILAAAN